jgi:hypothetical protein
VGLCCKDPGGWWPRRGSRWMRGRVLRRSPTPRRGCTASPSSPWTCATSPRSSGTASLQSLPVPFFVVLLNPVQLPFCSIQFSSHFTYSNSVPFLLTPVLKFSSLFTNSSSVPFLPCTPVQISFYSLQFSSHFTHSSSVPLPFLLTPVQFPLCSHQFSSLFRHTSAVPFSNQFRLIFPHTSAVPFSHQFSSLFPHTSAVPFPPPAPISSGSFSSSTSTGPRGRALCCGCART